MQGVPVTAEQAENREHGNTIRKFGGFVSLGGALLMMTVRVKGSDKAQKKAKAAKVVTILGGLGIFAITQLED